MKSTFKITEEDMVSSMQVHTKGKKITRTIMSVCGILLLIIGPMTNSTILYWSAALGGFCGYMLVYFVVTPFTAKKQFRENKLLKQDVEINIEKDGITFKNNSSKSFINWSDFLKWKTGKGMYLLYITSNMYQMIPFRAVDDNELFNEQLEKRIGQKED